MPVQLDKNLVKEISDEIKNALKTIGDKHDVKISLGSITYTPDSFSTKLTCTVFKDDDDGKRDLFFKNVKMLSRLFEISESDYLRTYRGGDGKQYVLVGINPKARTNFCMISDVSGVNRYVCAPEFLGIKRRRGI